jgi:hypothetical protein
VAGKEWKLLQRHLYFKDLANSTALLPALNGLAQPPLGQPALYTMKMPACYPYPDQVQYRVTWTGGATPNAAVPANSTAAVKPASLSTNKLAGNAPLFTAISAAPASCSLQSESGECWSDPHKDAAFSLAWPAMDNFAVTATPVRDKHSRKFDPPRTAQVNVSVQQGSATSSTQPTMQANSATVASTIGQGKDHGGNLVVQPTHVPNLIFQHVQNIDLLNPNHQPDLIPSLGPNVAASCSYPPSESCQQACPPFTATGLLGVNNLTQYAVTGPILVILQDMSGNTVRTWTIDGLAGNGEAFPGEFKYPAQFSCPTSGTTTVTGVTSPPTPNYVLLVKPPSGVTELQTNNNSAQIYIPPDATISP